MARIFLSFRSPIVGSVWVFFVSLTMASELPVSGVLDLYKKGSYQESVTQGLSALQTDPKNHDIRLIVADSLQRLGQLSEAKVQFEFLKGTPLDAVAVLRLNALEPTTKEVLPIQVPSARASVTVASPVAQYQYVPPAVPDLFGRSPKREVAPPAKTTLPLSSTTTPLSTRVPAAAVPQSATPAQQRILDLSAAADYRLAGTEGLALLAKEKTDDSLQLIVANSLAWTGRLEDAAVTYQGLTSGKYANDATVGLANIERWRGRDDRAYLLYQGVLASDPTNSGALEGIELATRELVPRTMMSFGGSLDSSEMERQSATIQHRWRDASGRRITEIAISEVRDALPTSLANQKEVAVSYQALDLVLKPTLELSMPTEGSSHVYGKIRLSLEDYKTNFNLGQVNWGRMASNPIALAAQLSATHVGVDATKSLVLGDFTGRVDWFDISDGNRIVTSSLRFASIWRPLGSHVKPFFGMETREAGFNTPNYWSPKQGFGSAYAGLLAEWGQADWNLFVSGQAGAPLYGDAGSSWSLSGGGKYWLSHNLAMSLNLWAMESVRDNAQYSAKAATFQLEHLWR